MLDVRDDTKGCRTVASQEGSKEITAGMTTQYNGNNAWYQRWSDGNVNNNNKNNGYNVVPAAAFGHNVMSGDGWIPLTEFINAYKVARRRCRRSVQQQRFEIGWREGVERLWREVNTHRYTVSPCGRFVVSYPKPREVFDSAFRDRVVETVVALKLEPLMERMFIVNSFSCRKYKGTLAAVQCLQEMMRKAGRDAWCLSMDVEGFFMSIPRQRLLSELTAFITERYRRHDRDTLLWLTAQIVTFAPERNFIDYCRQSEYDAVPYHKQLRSKDGNTGLAIGKRTSQDFGNFYLHALDIALMRICPLYARYQDDIRCVSADRRVLLNALRTARALLAGKGLQLHERKWSLQRCRHGIPFVGAVVRPRRIYVNSRTVHNAAACIRRCGKMTPDAENVRSLMQSLNAYFGYMRHYHTYTIRWRLTGLIPEQWRGRLAMVGNMEYFNINNKSIW